MPLFEIGNRIINTDNVNQIAICHFVTNIKRRIHGNPAHHYLNTYQEFFVNGIIHVHIDAEIIMNDGTKIFFYIKTESQPDEGKHINLDPSIKPGKYSQYFPNIDPNLKYLKPIICRIDADNFEENTRTQMKETLNQFVIEYVNQKIKASE